MNDSIQNFNIKKFGRQIEQILLIMTSEIMAKLEQNIKMEDFDIEVINDLSCMNNRQLNGVGFENQEIYQQMDHMHRSAPNINEMHSNYSFVNETDDFIMSSCQSINDYGYYFDGATEDISYEQDQEDRPFQSQDIFDRIDDLNFENVNGSLLEEENQEQDLQIQLKNNSNFSLDSAFNFDLKLNPNQNKFLNASSYTDRVSCSFIQRNFQSRSQQKNRGDLFIKNQHYFNKLFNDKTNTKIKNEHQFSMLKNKNNASNKKIFQPFTDYIKQSNILGQILPSNNINDSITQQKSLFLDQKQKRRPIKIDQNILQNSNKQKLLKKIDKLLFSNSNRKLNKIIIQKVSESRQRKELKIKKCSVKEFGKENYKKIQVIQHKNATNRNLGQKSQLIKSEMKIFKRSKNLKESFQKKKSIMNKQMEIFTQDQLILSKKQRTKQALKNHNFKQIQINMQILEDTKILGQLKKDMQKKQVFTFKELSQSLITKLEQTLCADTMQLFVELSQIYEQLTSSEPIILITNIDQKKKLVQKQQKQNLQKMKILESKQILFKNQMSYSQITSQKQQYYEDKEAILIKSNKNQGHQVIEDKKNGEKMSNSQMFKNMYKKREQMRKQFDIWKQMSL